jgi:hypothetical protein
MAARARADDSLQAVMHTPHMAAQQKNWCETRPLPNLPARHLERSHPSLVYHLIVEI